MSGEDTFECPEWDGYDDSPLTEEEENEMIEDYLDWFARKYGGSEE